MYATGTVQAWNGNAWTGLAYGRVTFYYRHKGATTWTQDYGAQTNQYGNFGNIVGVHLRTADWQVRVQPAADTLPSTGINTVHRSPGFVWRPGGPLRVLVVRRGRCRRGGVPVRRRLRSSLR